ncbi:MAG TPA: hypothetical protein VGL94_08090 [Ktedonobacteraceae bacterium]
MTNQIGAATYNGLELSMSVRAIGQNNIGQDIVQVKAMISVTLSDARGIAAQLGIPIDRDWEPVGG